MHWPTSSVSAARWPFGRVRSNAAHHTPVGEQSLAGVLFFPLTQAVIFSKFQRCIGSPLPDGPDTVRLQNHRGDIMSKTDEPVELSAGQYRELATAVLKALPDCMDPRTTQYLIEDPLLLRQYLNSWLRGVPRLDVDQRYGAPLAFKRTPEGCAHECYTFGALSVPAGYAGMRISDRLPEDLSDAWHRQEKLLEGRTFVPYVLKADQDWRLDDMVMHIWARGMMFAWPQHLIKFAAANPTEPKMAKRLVAFEPVMLRGEPHYTVLVAHKDKTSWELIPARHAQEWRENDHVLTVIEDRDRTSLEL